MSELLNQANKRQKRYSMSAFLLGLSLGTIIAASWIVYQYEIDKSNSANIHQSNTDLEQTLRYIETEYVNDINITTLRKAAIRGVMQELDSHSAYLDNIAYSELLVDTDGTYTGMGLEAEWRDSNAVITKVYENSSADKNGLKVGDTIHSFNNKTIDANSFNRLQEHLIGELGSKLSISIKAKDQSNDTPNIQKPQLRTVTLESDVIRVDSVHSINLNNQIIYTQVSQFTETSAQELISAIHHWQAKIEQLKGVILDLRNNPGGLVESSVEVADLFLSEGTIVTAAGRSTDSKFSHHATEGDILNNAPLIVLINHATASSAEIVAGALKDKDRAIVIGYPSYGKGSVQSVIPMDDGDALKLTTSYYYTPNGISINQRGVKPNIQIEESSLSIKLKELHELNEELFTSSNANYKLAKTLAIKDPTLYRAWQYLQRETKTDQLAMDLK